MNSNRELAWTIVQSASLFHSHESTAAMQILTQIIDKHTLAQP